MKIPPPPTGVLSSRQLKPAVTSCPNSLPQTAAFSTCQAVIVTMRVSMPS